VICGGPAIWKMLTPGSSIKSVQNIPWKKIDAAAEDYIKTQEYEIEKLELELKNLATLIAERKAQEAPVLMTPTQNDELIVSALGSFDGLENAQRTKCGKPSIRPRAPRGAYRKSEEAFDSAAAAYFAGGNLRLDGAAFRDACEKLLPSGEDSYCGPLCQSFKDMVQAVSDAAVGDVGGQGSDELVKQEAKKLEELERAKSEAEQCKKAREGLLGFGGQLQELNTAQKDRLTDLQNAEWDLDDALWDLDDLDAELEKEEEALTDAEEALATAGAELVDAQTALATVKEKEKSLQTRVSGMKEPLANLRHELEATKNADRVLIDLKSAVSATMMKMQLFFEFAVLEPIRFIGLDEDMLLSDYFPDDPSSIESASVLQGAVEALHDFCATDAIAAFNEVKDAVDLSPLCAFSAPDQIKSDLDKAVSATMSNIKDQIKWVQSWLDPFKGNGKMTAEEAARHVAAGEPKGLQEIVGVYKHTTFFQYLKEWRLGGPYLKLIDELKNVIDSLDKALQKLMKELEGLKSELVETAEARKAATEALDEATKAENVAAETKAIMEEKVKVLKDRSTKLNQKIEDLEGKVADAKKQYEKAKDKLVAAHQEGTSLLQSRKEDSLEALQAQGAKAWKRVALIERLLERAEESYRAA